MDRRRKILVNNYEKLADELINKAVKPYGARVCPKIGLKDILDINNSGISNEEYSYALKAHIDFCVVNHNDFVEFGLEIDESHHFLDSETIKKDKIKDKLCSKLGFPLLRISDKSLEKVKNLEILAWLTSYYFAFTELARNRNDLRDPNIQKKLFLLKEPFVYSPFADSYESIRTFAKKRLPETIANEMPLCMLVNSTTYFISWAGFQLRPYISMSPSERKPLLYSKTAFRMFNDFAGIYPFHLSEGLAVVELDRKIKSYIEGSYTPKQNETLDSMIEEVADEYHKTHPNTKSQV